MNEYELTIVLPGDATVAKKKSVIGKVGKFVTTVNGKTKKTDDWGKIELANKLKGETDGNFIYFILELNGSEIKSLSEKLKMEDDISNHLLVKKEK